MRLLPLAPARCECQPTIRCSGAARNTLDVVGPARGRGGELTTRSDEQPGSLQLTPKTRGLRGRHLGPTSSSKIPSGSSTVAAEQAGIPHPRWLSRRMGRGLGSRAAGSLSMTEQGKALRGLAEPRAARPACLRAVERPPEGQAYGKLR